jgi:hypothetical protein
MYFSLILKDVFQDIKDKVDKNLEPCYSYNTFNENKEELHNLLETVSVRRYIGELKEGKTYAVIKPISKCTSPLMPCVHKFVIEEYKYLGNHAFCEKNNLDKKLSFPDKILIEID